MNEKEVLSPEEETLKFIEELTTQKAVKAYGNKKATLYVFFINLFPKKKK